MLTVQGQPRALAQVQRSLRAGRLASTWMFAGPAGTGKFTLAVQLAKTILCDHPVKEKNAGRIPHLEKDFPLTLSCGTCDSCKAADSLNHPDLHIITKELIRYHDAGGKSKGTNLSIHVIRGEITGDPAENKEAKIAKRSFRGKGKVFIIDEADLMEPPAQNALLKTLEEPPPGTYLIMITASPQELLSTIRSRSQLVEFGPLPDAVITAALVKPWQTPGKNEEGDPVTLTIPGLPTEDAALLARLARGSLGRALRWRQDVQVIERENAKSAARAEKKKAKAGGDDDGDDELTDKFTPGGILAWTRELSAQLDALAAGRAAASDVAIAISKFAAEYAALHLQRDKLASADRAKRDGIALFMAIAAEWFADRLRHALGTPYPAPLPAESGGLDHGIIPRLIATARAAEHDIDWNANDKILLTATTTRWEELLRQ
jgi:DNA polymerase III subunit delta'